MDAADERAAGDGGPDADGSPDSDGRPDTEGGDGAEGRATGADELADAGPGADADRVVAILPGDGIGPEVVAQARRVLEAVAERRELALELQEALVGGAAMDATGDPLPAETLELCDGADAILLGAVGGPAWDDPGARTRPEAGLLRLRKELGLFANLRPVTARVGLRAISPVKDRLLEGVDLILVRENTGGLYFGPRKREGDTALDTLVYSEPEVARVVRVACELARRRSGRLTSVDKANVLDTSRLWRETVERVTAEEYPEVRVEHLLVDAMAIHLIRRPAEFDVIVTENMFGDILSDEASVLAGSVGMIPSASLGDGVPGLFEPVHGSAPSLVGQGNANPYAAILSVALLLRHGLDREVEARGIELAVEAAIESGARTADIATSTLDSVGTESAGDAVLRALDGALSAADSGG